jgi:hypothetical protein
MEKSQVVAQIEPTTVFPLWNAGFQRLLLLLWGFLTTKTAQTTIASGTGPFLKATAHDS